MIWSAYYNWLVISEARLDNNDEKSKANTAMKNRLEVGTYIAKP